MIEFTATLPDWLVYLLGVVITVGVVVSVLDIYMKIKLRNMK